ncbi:MAG: hypothetical protein AB1546_14420 [bacterium]
MANRIDIKQLQRELWKVAEREARKKPSIAKRRLKKKLREQVFGPGALAKVLPESTIKTINATIDEITEMVIKLAEFSIRVQKPAGKKLPGRPKKKAKKKANGRRKRRGKTLAATIEEIVRNNKGRSMRVSDIKKVIIEKKVRGDSRNLYPIITTALKKSPKFEKVGPGEFKLVKK